MGIESMEQVQHHVTDAGIAGVIEKYCSRHKELEAEVSKMLLRAGQPEKEPGVMVSTFSWNDYRCKNDDRRRRKQTGC